MTPLQIVAVGVRLFALAWLLYVVNNLHQFFVSLDRDTFQSSNHLGVWIAVGVQLGLCALLWLFPRTIAAKLLSSRESEVPAPRTSLAEWQTLGVILIGLWALADAVRNAIYWISLVNFTKGDFAFFSAEYKASMILTVFEMAIALWLLLGAKGLAALLFKIRTAGQSE